ncbi:unnamed protein product [Penicillium palitans]
MEYTNSTVTMTFVMTVFQTLVHEPTRPSSPSPTPSMPPKSSTAIDNLSKLPGGLWALVILAASTIVGGIVWFAYTKANKKKKEEEGDKPKEAEGIPLDTLNAAAMTPQAAISARWLRTDDKPSRPLPVIMEATGPNVAVPDLAGLTHEDVKLVPVPPGFRLPPPAPAPPAPAPVVVSAASPPPRRKKRDPAAVSATTTTVRNISHGAKEIFKDGSTAAVAPAV